MHSIRAAKNPKLIATRVGILSIRMALVSAVLCGQARAQGPAYHSVRQNSDRAINTVIVRVREVYIPSSTSGPTSAEAGATRRFLQLAAELGVAEARPLIRSRGPQGASINQTQPGANTFVISVPNGQTPEQLLQEFQTRSWVEYAEIDSIVTLHDHPNDPLWSRQWDLHNTGQPYWSVRGVSGLENDTLIDSIGIRQSDLRFLASYESSEPSSDVLVGVIDTGLDTAHVDLHDRLAPNPGEIPGNGVDDDNNGLIDDIYGWDFSGNDVLFPLEISGDNDIADAMGHGTHVAGTIGATVNNGFGIAGVCPRARIMGIKIFPNPFFSISAEAIYYATDRGARVINMSWGGSFRSRAIEDALQYAHDRGVVLVASMGNSGRDEVFYPSGYSTTIGVGSSTADDELSRFSTFNNFIDLVAPGQDILSLRATGTDLYADAGEPGVHIIADKYLIASGTSMSSPHAAGAAAVLLSFAPGLSNERVREILRASADDIVDPFGNDSLNLPGFDRHAGAGRINLERALTMLPRVLLEVTSHSSGARLTGEVITISGRAVGVGFAGLSASLIRSLNAKDHIGIEIPQSEITTTGGEFEIHIRRADTLAGPYTLRLDAGADAVLDWPMWFGNGIYAEIEAPVAGDTIQLLSAIVGRAYAPNFKSYSVTAVGPLPFREDHPIVDGGKIHWGDTLAMWRTDSLENGTYALILNVYTGNDSLSDTVHVQVQDAFLDGFPIDLPTPSHFAVATVNLDGVGGEEIICPTQNGLYVLESNGQIYPGWPRATDFNVTTAPAVADLDRDGKSEIIVASRSYVHVYAFIGEVFAGWPKPFLGGSGVYGNSMPVIGDVDGAGGLEVAAIDRHGRIAIWHADGAPYAPNGDEFFARIEIDRTLGSSLPRLAICDIDRDGHAELIAAGDGIYVYDAATGGPFDGSDSVRVSTHFSTHGMVVGDYDGDGIFEIAYVATEGVAGRFALHVIDAHGESSPGWPHEIPLTVNHYLQYSLSAGDVDQDNVPELFFAPYSLGDGYLYAFHGNGAPLGSDSSTGLLAVLPGTISAITLVNIDRDESPDIVMRVGEFISGPDRIYAFKPDGELVPGYPIMFGEGNATTMPAPIIGDIDADGIADMTTVQSTSKSVAVWNLGIPVSIRGHVWPRFSGDLWNSNVAPALRYDVAYLVRMINLVLHGGYPLPPFEPTDVDCDGETSLSDVVYLKNYLFHDGPRPCRP